MHATGNLTTRKQTSNRTRLGQDFRFIIDFQTTLSKKERKTASG